MIQFYRCTGVLVSDVTILEPAMWTIHPVLSTNVTVRGVTVVSNLYNTDGCDPESSSYVHIVGCRFNTNDDCVAVKSGRDEDGHRVGVPSEKIVIERCLFSGRWGGVTVGSEMSGGVRDIFAEKCVCNAPEFPGHHRLKYPLYIKANKRRGSYIDGVHLRKFTAYNLERDPVFITANYNRESGVHPVAIRNIHFDKLTVHGFDRYPINIEGLASDPVTGVYLSKWELTGASDPPLIQYANDLRLEKVVINGVEVS